MSRVMTRSESRGRASRVPTPSPNPRFRRPERTKESQDMRMIRRTWSMVMNAAILLFASPACLPEDAEFDAPAEEVEEVRALDTSIAPAPTAPQERRSLGPALPLEIPVQLSWTDVQRGSSRDFRPAGSALRLAVRNTLDVRAQVSLTATIVADGREHPLSLGVIELAPGASTDVDVPLVPAGMKSPRELDLSAQVQVLAEVRVDGEARIGASAPELFFHEDRREGLLVYDGAGLKSRHRAGDIHDRYHVGPDTEVISRALVVVRQPARP